MRIIPGALRSVFVVVSGVLAGGGLLLIVNSDNSSEEAAVSATIESMRVEEEEAYQDQQRQLEELMAAATTTTTTTIPPTTVAETLPPETSQAEPQATTTTTLPDPPYVQDRAVIGVNEVFGWVDAPRLERGNLTLARADITEISPKTGKSEAGMTALKGAGTAWYDGSALLADGTSGQNLALPGEGGIVAIGGHREGVALSGPFGNLHLLEAGDDISIVTYFKEVKPDGTTIQHNRVSVYKVTVPCPEEDQSHCTGDRLLLHDLASREVTGETLFLFTCDGDSRIFVEAKLVQSSWQK